MKPHTEVLLSGCKSIVSGLVAYRLLDYAPRLAPALAMIATLGARPHFERYGQPKIVTAKWLEPFAEALHTHGLMSIVAGVQTAALLRSPWGFRPMTPLLAYSAAELIYTKVIVASPHVDAWFTKRMDNTEPS
jgi:hypothetical protein